MDLPIDEKEFEFILQQVWKCRNSEPKCKELYNKLQLVKELKDKGAPYKKIMREQFGFVA